MAYRPIAGFLLALALFKTPSAVAQNYGTTLRVLDNWQANTDAKINLAIETINPFAARVIWCTTRTDGICGGECTVYNGFGGKCFATPGTSCIAATRNVNFCDTADCTGSCNLYTHCGTIMDDGFCYTPGTRSVQIPLLDPSNPSPSASLSSTTSSREPSTSTHLPPNLPSLTGSPPPSTSAGASSSFTLPVSPLSPIVSSSSTSPPFIGVGDNANAGDVDSTEENSSFPVGAIVGIVLGALAIIVVTILVIVWFRRKQRHDNALQLYAQTEPFIVGSNAPSTRGPLSSPPPMSYTPSQTSGYAYGSPLALPQHPTHARSISDLASTVTTSTSTNAGPQAARKGQTLHGPVSRTEDVPASQLVYVHADSGIRAPRRQEQGVLELPPQYTPS